MNDDSAAQTAAVQQDRSNDRGTGVRSRAAARRQGIRDIAWNAAIAAFALVMIIAIWVITLERITHEHNGAVADAHRQNSTLAMTLEAHTVRTLKSVDQALRQVVREYGEEGMKLNLAQFIKDGAIDGSILHNVGVIDARGDVILNSLEFQPTTASDREYFRVHRERDDVGVFIGKPLLGRVTGKWALHVSRRISNPDGSFGGVAFAALDPNYFTTLYQQARLKRQDLITIVGLDGITRARYVGEVHSFGQDVSGSTLFAELAKRPVGNFVNKGRLEGVPRFRSYRKLQDFPLVVAVGTSIEDTLSEFRQRQRIYYLGSASASAIILLFSGLLLVALSRQRRAAAAQAASEARLRATFDQAAAGIALTALDDRIIGANDVLGEALGCAGTELQGRSFQDFIDPVDRPALREDREKLLSGAAATATRELRFIRKDASSGWANRGLALVRDAEGAPDYFISVFQDITDRKLSEGKLRESEQRFSQMAENIGEVFWMAPPDLHSMTYVSPAFEKVWGIPCASLYSNPRVWLEAIHPDDAPSVIRTLGALAEGEPYDIEFRIRRPDGSLRWVNDRGYPLKDADGRVVLTTGVASDVTERRLAEEQSRLSAKAFESIADGIIVTDSALRIVSVNEAFSAITGYASQEVLGKSPKMLQSGRHGAAFYAGMWQEIARIGHWKGETWDQRKNGEVYPQLLSISAVRDESGAVSHYVGVCTDISSLKQYEQKLHHQAHHDALTGLPNRVLFQDRFGETLNRARRAGSQGAVLFLDLDRFKTINDSLGHAVGDLLLRSVATRLSASLRQVDTVARFGGDEFAVLLDTIEDNQNAAVVAQKLLDALAHPFDLGGHQFYISTSIGISCYPQDGLDAEVLLKNADTAMYRAKAEGRNNYQFYSAEMNARAMENLEMSNHLRRALERDEFELHFQPCLNLKSGRITGVEALIRWRHPERGMVPPARFIPLAEETGLIEPIGEWVLRTACRQMRAWRDAGLPLHRVAVNLSARQFRHPDLLQRIAGILEEARLPAHCLELEVTESMVMHDPEDAAEVLSRLKEKGISIAIDDFGTGYSSLSYLKRFPIDYLKIDRSFVSGVPADPEDAAIIEAVIALARSLGLKLIAEGVESAEQREFLKRSGCDEAQGYLFSKPVTAPEIERMLAREAHARVPSGLVAA